MRSHQNYIKKPIDTSIEEQRETTMADLREAMGKAARDTLQFKEPLRERAGCHPDFLPLVDARLQAIKNYDSERAKPITNEFKKKARNSRAKEQGYTFENNKWDPVKYAKKEFNAKHTSMINPLGELVPDSLRAEAQAKKHEQVQWTLNNIEECKQFNINTEPIFEECPDMKTDHIIIDELNHAINRSKSKKTPGPDGVPSELYK